MRYHRAPDDPVGHGAGPEYSGRIKQRASGVGLSSSLADPLDADAEDAYWHETFHTRPYARSEWRWEDLRPAYRFGWEACARYRGRRFDEVAAALERDWQSRTPQPMLPWEQARGAVRDAWERVEGSRPGPDEERH